MNHYLARTCGNPTPTLFHHCSMFDTRSSITSHRVGLHASYRLVNDVSILLVDDERDIANVLKSGLEGSGNADGPDVHVFTDPALALSTFLKNPQAYAIVISDIRMPGMTGFHLVKEIRELNAGVKVILMSSFEINRSEFAKEPGFAEVDFMQKPIGITELRNVVTNHLGESSDTRRRL